MSSETPSDPFDRYISPDLVPLIGARNVRVSEPDEAGRLAEGLINELTLGEPLAVIEHATGARGAFRRFHRRIRAALERWLARALASFGTGMAGRGVQSYRASQCCRKGADQ